MNRDKYIHLEEASKMLNRRRKMLFRPVGKFLRKGSPLETCIHIVKKCYDAENGFFKTSAGHFSSFYIRDFSWCIEPLINLGFTDECRNTLRWAVSAYLSEDRVTTCITKRKQCFDFPGFGADSLPSLLYCIYTAGLTPQDCNWDFLRKTACSYLDRVYDPATGWMRGNVSKSSIRDHRIKDGSCYDACMFYMFVHYAEKLNLGLTLPLTDEEVSYKIKKRFINSSGCFTEYVCDRVSGGKITGVSSVFPFWTKVVEDRAHWIMTSSIVNAHGLVDPFPMRFEKKYIPGKFSIYRFFAPNYQGNTVWLHIGLLYCRIQLRYNPGEFKRSFEPVYNLIKKYKTVIEVYRPGKTWDTSVPYKSLFYVSDIDMLWASIAAELMMSYTGAAGEKNCVLHATCDAVM